MAGNTALEAEALNGLVTSLHRDANYETWSLFDLRGHLLLDYPDPPPTAELQFLQPGDKQHLIASAWSLYCFGQLGSHCASVGSSL